MSPENQNNTSQSDPRFNRQPPSLISKVLAFIVGAGFLVLAFMFSLVALAVIVVVGLGLWAWLWWKTRAIRKQMREQVMQSPSSSPAGGDGFIIEGEVVREENPPTKPDNLLR